jgi:hypothetical protein
MNTGVRIDWTEYERGWGNRPDGTTLHRTMEVAKSYIENHWSNQPNKAPDEYSSPGTPRIVQISDFLYERLLINDSIWVENTKWPTDVTLQNNSG